MTPLPNPDELEASLWRDLLDRWFPACIDPQGGFRQNFDAAFQPSGDEVKGLVFQSRMLWVCATVAALRPEFADYARHGVRFLRDRMGDRYGLAWSVRPDHARARPAEETHAYGVSFAIYGLAAAGLHLGDQEALAAAILAFYDLERGHYDREHGGYFEVASEGKPWVSGEAREGGIGTPPGQKSQNTHLHLLESLTELYRAWPDPLVRQRLEETLGILAQRFFTEPGHLTLFVHSDWSPASTDVSYGHDIEAAHLMLDAADALGLDGEAMASVLQRARALTDRTLAEGWDARDGGIFYAGTAEGPTDRSKNWWAQAEALLGFAALWRRTGEARYGEALAGEWAFIRERQIDRVHGGWFEEAGRPEMAKGHAWKAAYHDGRALLFTVRLLRGQP